MDDNTDPTIIRKALNDFDKFLNQADSRRRETFSLSRNSVSSAHSLSKKVSFNGSPACHKLSFSESINMDGYDNSDDYSGAEYMSQHQDNIAGLNIVKKIREKDREIVNAKTSITLLESQMQKLKTDIRESKAEFDSEIQLCRRKEIKDQEMIEEIKKKLEQSEEKENQIKEELQQLQKTTQEKITQLEKRIMMNVTQTDEKNTAMEEKCEYFKKRMFTLEIEDEEKKAEIEILLNENKDLQNKYEENIEKLKEFEYFKLKEKNMNLELQNVKNQNMQLQRDLSGLKEKAEGWQEYEQAMNKVTAIKEENAKLKKENHEHKITTLNVGLIEEKLSAANSRIRNLERQCSELNVENGTLLTQKSQWEAYESVIRDECSNIFSYLPSPEELKQYLVTVKKPTDKEELHNITALQQSIKSHSDSRISQDEKLHKFKQDLESSEKKVERNAQLVKRLQRKLMLVSKERDALQNIIHSYESESTLNPTAIQHERLTALQEQLNDYKEEMERMEKECSLLPAIGGACSTQQQAEVSNNTARVNELSQKNKSLQAQVQDLQSQQEELQLQLEHQTLKGGFNPAQTKVLHFKDNPLSKTFEGKIETIEKLEQENESLKTRIKLLEEGEREDITQKVTQTVSKVGAKETQELQEKVNSLQIRNERIIEAFKKKSKEMREVVYRLLGYRVDLDDSNQIKLISMYAESHSDCLLFQRSKNDELQLLNNDYSYTLEYLIEAYLCYENSFPAFLSAVTLDLFNKDAEKKHTRNVSEAEEEEEEEGEEEIEEEEEEEDNEEEDNEEYEDYEDNDAGPTIEGSRLTAAEFENQQEPPMKRHKSNMQHMIFQHSEQQQQQQQQQHLQAQYQQQQLYEEENAHEDNDDDDLIILD